MSREAAYLLVAALAIGWGSVSLIVRLVSAPTSVAAFYRVVFAAAVVAAAVGTTGRAHEWWKLARRPAAAAMGACLALHWLCFFAALRETSVASAVFATTCTPIFLALLAPLVLREWPNAVAQTATGLGLAGVALMTGLGDPAEVRPAGVALGLTAALLGALIPVVGKYLGRSSTAVAMVGVQTAVAAVVLLPLALSAGIAVAPADLGWLAVLGVAHTALALTLYYRALQRLPVQTAGVLGLLEPVSAATLAWLVLGEAASVTTILGGGLIVAGALLVRPGGA